MILIPGFLNVTHVLDIKVARLKSQAQKWIVCIFVNCFQKSTCADYRRDGKKKKKNKKKKKKKKKTLIFLCIFSFGNYEVMTRNMSKIS